MSLRITYAIPGLLYDDDTPVTFEADDVEASTVTLEKLIRIGQGNAENQRFAYWDRQPQKQYEVPEDGPEDKTLHRWAWNYARHRLTNYDELVRQFGDEGKKWDLCEECQAKADDTDEEEGCGLDVGCDDCERNREAARDEANEHINALRMGVAAWVKTRWPQLQIDEDHRDADGLGFSQRDLREAIRELRAVPAE